MDVIYGSQFEIVNGFTYVGIYFSNRLSLYKMAEVMFRPLNSALNIGLGY